MHILEAKIREARAAGRLALIPFVTAGFPSRERFWGVLRELDEAGADIIEIGVPFSDPVADGPVVEAASQRALQSGVTLRGLMRELVERKGELNAGLVLMGYMNPFLQYGLERFADNAARAGVHGVIVPDLPLDEAGTMRRILQERGLALIALVGPNTSEERMMRYAEVSEGYAYVVSVMGITGERGQLPPEVPQVLARARRAFPLPVALGFGLRSPEQLAALPAGERPDAAVFGSSLLRHLDAGGSPREFMARWTS
ncbi:tryptophan synthase subunit alpha [Mailhella sp.]|uniref:tryptophan synthase subunit alpha n=1 Tax=Mailhella sp. TaxID=1981029 RepID=UPI0040630EE2